MNPKHPFKWRHFQSDIIRSVRSVVLAVSPELPQNGFDDAVTGTDGGLVRRSTALVQAYAPELDKRCRVHLKPTNDTGAG